MVELEQEHRLGTTASRPADPSLCLHCSPYGRSTELVGVCQLLAIAFWPGMGVQHPFSPNTQAAEADL